MLFYTPTEFIPRIISGDFQRYGTIIKDVSSGRIVGHLKEAGDLASSLAKLNPFDPLNLVSQVSQMQQLNQIKHTLDRLQLISSVGAVASVANLGLCAVGFTVVYKKLNRIDDKCQDPQDYYPPK